MYFFLGCKWNITIYFPTDLRFGLWLKIKYTKFLCTQQVHNYTFINKNKYVHNYTRGLVHILCGTIWLSYGESCGWKQSMKSWTELHLKRCEMFVWEWLATSFHVRTGGVCQSPSLSGSPCYEPVPTLFYFIFYYYFFFWSKLLSC
jgi:hypothetical protein